MRVFSFSLSFSARIGVSPWLSSRRVAVAAAAAAAGRPLRPAGTNDGGGRQAAAAGEGGRGGSGGGGGGTRARALVAVNDAAGGGRRGGERGEGGRRRGRAGGEGDEVALGARDNGARSHSRSTLNSTTNNKNNNNVDDITGRRRTSPVWAAHGGAEAREEEEEEASGDQGAVGCGRGVQGNGERTQARAQRRFGHGYGRRHGCVASTSRNNGAPPRDVGRRNRTALAQCQRSGARNDASETPREARDGAVARAGGR